MEISDKRHKEIVWEALIVRNYASRGAIFDRIFRAKNNHEIVEQALKDENILLCPIASSFLGTPADPDSDIFKQMRQMGLAMASAKKGTLYVPEQYDPYMLARQLGHCHLHVKKDGDFPQNFLHTETGVLGAEADLFAANLLMPKEWFLKLWSKHPRDIPTIARIVGAPTYAVKARHYALVNG